MAELDERQINIKINDEVKKYSTLKKAFLQLYESETKAGKARNETFNKFNGLKEDDNNSLKDIYSSFIDEMKNLEKYRDTHLKKIMDLILPVIDIYPEKLKNSKKDLESLSKVRKNMAKLEKSRNEIKNGDVDQVQSINKELAKSKNEERIKEESIESGLMKFESERCEDNKNLFLQYIHSELKYHAAVLQELSELFNSINEKEPFEDLENFAKKYNIEVDLKKDFNIDMDEINLKKEIREKKEKEKANNVYGSGDYDDEEEIKKSIKSNPKINDNNLGSEYQDN